MIFMAKSIDVATYLLDKSIERAQEDSSYYMDFIKLHKLMYLGKCYLDCMYGIDLFEEDITANSDGPYIKGINSVPAVCGFGKITNIDELKQYLKNDILPLSLSREEICDAILDMFGKYSTLELVRITKNTLAYKNCYSTNHNNIMNKELMVKTGEMLFANKEKEPILIKRK